jgi:DNA (cytosine-5)-methyltransferase 1
VLAHSSSSANSDIYVDTMPVRKKPNFHETIKSCNWKGQTLKPEDTVQLSSGDFLFIKSILQEQQSIVLSGFLLRRNSDFEGRLPKKLNEVYFIHSHEVVRGEVYDHSMKKFPLRHIVNVRELVRTNKTWVPRFRSKDTPGQTREKQEHIRHNISRLPITIPLVRLVKNNY